MQGLPAYETARKRTGALAGGHCWVEELIDGPPLRFSVADSGLIEFGDDQHTFDGDVPLRYAHAVRSVRERLDREAIRSAVEDPTTLTFVGVATTLRDTEYDWAALPGFLGTGVYDDDRGRFLPPDTTQQVFERVGLDPVTVVEREVRALDVDPESYPMPESEWRDGPAVGVVFANKSGGRAVLRPEQDSRGADGVETAEQLRDLVSADDWLSDITAELAEGSVPVTVDAVVERAIERIGRETRAFDDGGVSAPEIRPKLAERAARLPDVQS